MPAYKLLAGLGNPGREYENTRHNLGFMALDAVLEESAARFPGAVRKLGGPPGRYEAWRFQAGADAGEVWIALKPLSYMNLSGEAVSSFVQYYKINLPDVLVAHDELDLPLGGMRLKFGGGAAGHKGILSIAGQLGSPDFYRLRLGIGKTEDGAVSHVLGKFRPEEAALVRQVVKAAAQGFFAFAGQGFEAAKTFVNGFKI